MTAPVAWVFVPDTVEGPTIGSSLPTHAFGSYEDCLQFVAEKQLSGLATAYVLDVSHLEWCWAQGLLKSPERTRRIETFTSAYLPHAHFKHGEEIAEPSGPPDLFAPVGNDKVERVWAFSGVLREGKEANIYSLPSVVFSRQEIALAWIQKHGASGALTRLECSERRLQNPPRTTLFNVNRVENSE